MVDGILPGKNDVGDWDKGVALLKEGLDNRGQGLRRVVSRVVKQDDGARLDLCGHPLDNLAGGQVLPVQAVTEGNKGKRRLGSS